MAVKSKKLLEGAGYEEGRGAVKTAVRGGAAAKRRMAGRPRSGCVAASASGTAPVPKTAILAGSGTGGGGGEDDGAGARVGALRRWREGQESRGASLRSLVLDLHVRKGLGLGAVAEALGLGEAEVAREWRGAQGELAAGAPSREEDFTTLREELAARLRHTIEQTHVWVPMKVPGAAAACAGARSSAAGAPAGSGTGGGVGPDDAAGASVGAGGGRRKRGGARGALASSSAAASVSMGASADATEVDEAVADDFQGDAGAQCVAGGGGHEALETMVEVQPSTQMLAIRLKAMDQLSKLYGMSLEREPAPQGPQPYAAPEEVAEGARRRLLQMHGVAGAEGKLTVVDDG